MKKWTPVLLCLGMMLFAAPIAQAADPGNVTLTVLYDNYSARPALTAEWGFSCLIRTGGKTLLFDTGRTWAVFDHNLEKLNIQPTAVQSVVISHNHSDHTGNLFNLLSEKHDVTVYLPKSFPDPFVEKVTGSGARVHRTEAPTPLGDGMVLTGEIPGENINEQALVVATAHGPLLVVGCAHPGIVTMVQKARRYTHRDVYMVIGGFHMMDMSADRIKEQIRQLQHAGVQKIAPTHCTGPVAIQLFKDAYGDACIATGAGTVITMPVGR